MTWKEASTLILAARSLGKRVPFDSRAVESTRTRNVDFDILMLERSSQSSFMASTYVFPGGAVDASDYATRWWSLFEKFGFPKDSLIKQIKSRVSGSRPSMVTDSISKSLFNESTHADPLIPEIALRITAIRETFEEAGLPVLFNPIKSNSESEKPIEKGTLVEWKEKIRQNGDAFFDMCTSLGQLPDIWSLYEWWNWATPKLERSKRFDTMFYIHCLDHRPQVALDNAEVVSFKWLSPVEILDHFAERKVILAPPQVFELARIANFTQLTDLHSFSGDREKFGVERWLPVLIKTSDGREAYLPGDVRYPEDPESDLKPGNSGNEEQLIQSGVPINRLISKGSSFSYHSNCDDCGHPKPLFNH